MDRRRAERAREVFGAETLRKQQQKLGEVSTRQALQLEATLQRHREAPMLIDATNDTLAALEAAGFPGISMVQVRRPRFLSKDRYKITDEPGWNLVSQPNDYVENVGGSRRYVYLLAEGNYYVATSHTGSSGRATAHTYHVLSPEEYGNEHGIGILPILEQLKTDAQQ